MDFIKANDVQMVDFKMVDINGQFRHVTIPATNFSEDTMKDGVGFDASNYGYAVVEKSDMVFIPVDGESLLKYGPSADWCLTRESRTVLGG